MDEEREEQAAGNVYISFGVMGWVTGEESVVHTKFGSVSSYMTVSVYACKGRLWNTFINPDTLSRTQTEIDFQDCGWFMQPPDTFHSGRHTHLQLWT